MEGKSENKKPMIDISRVGISPRLAKLSLSEFKKWAEVNNFGGDIEGAYKKHKSKIEKRKK